MSGCIHVNCQKWKSIPMTLSGPSGRNWYHRNTIINNKPKISMDCYCWLTTSKTYLRKNTKYVYFNIYKFFQIFIHNI